LPRRIEAVGAAGSQAGAFGKARKG